MENKTNNFKANLKKDVPAITVNPNTSTYTIESLLSSIGLSPLPDNVETTLSNDNKYLNIKLKDTSTESHLLFQFPLEERDLSPLKSRPDYHDLINRYNLYINDYIYEIKDYSMRERAYLGKRFPGLVFNIKIRIKSFDSYIDKLNDNILEGKDPYINDLIAERIILSEYNDSKDETLLTNLCDDVSKALYDFRISTNFRMKKNLYVNPSISDKDYISKDYIEHPKDNGYQSIHILMEHKYNTDLRYETQIRTFDMENLSKTSGEIAHSQYKPRILNDLATNRVPMYYAITSFDDSLGHPDIIDVPLANRFYHYYNSDRSEHIPITYEKFRKEQYELESILGTSFKSIRCSLRNIHSKNFSDISNESER